MLAAAPQHYYTHNPRMQSSRPAAVKGGQGELYRNPSWGHQHWIGLVYKPLRSTHHHLQPPGATGCTDQRTFACAPHAAPEFVRVHVLNASQECAQLTRAHPYEMRYRGRVQRAPAEVLHLREGGGTAEVPMVQGKPALQGALKREGGL
mmetsp:Transcript_16963/g.46858  ORF Transcript_16963/g.46858 Transcript_16963/m.46858 type:complete len:149 (-) Transcript_16963:3025-3471(-)|eukprot:scaffold107458_cov20-Tisochrysis_lutea.AAC.1